MHEYDSRVPYLIIGCKSDLRDDLPTVNSLKSKGLTMVSQEEVCVHAEQLHSKKRMGKRYTEEENRD